VTARQESRGPKQPNLNDYFGRHLMKIKNLWLVVERQTVDQEYPHGDGLSASADGAHVKDAIEVEDDLSSVISRCPLCGVGFSAGIPEEKMVNHVDACLQVTSLL
jgi:hypothetical protein